MEIVFNEETRPRFVETSNNQAPQVKPKDEAKLKSNQTQRTKLETWQRPDQLPEVQASLSSGGQQGAAKQGKTEKTSAEKQTADATTDSGDYSVADSRKPLQLPGYGGSQAEPIIPANVQDEMPAGVRLGNITALNTDQHRHYSFNHRLLSLFVPIWGARVKRAVYQWVEENNFPPVSKSWVTNVEVIMDPSGEIIDVQPFRLSGLWPIDNASIDSFKEVRNVPNPPKEMIDDNGYIHLQFQTEVLWIPQPRVRFHGGGPE